MSTRNSGPLGCDAQRAVIDRGTLSLVSSAMPKPYGVMAEAMIRLVPKAVAATREQCAGAITQYEARYGNIIKAGSIDIDKNVREAATMSPGALREAVTNDNKWNYKSNPKIVKEVPDRLLRDEFGNFHFGVIAASRGLGLHFATLGAGAHQVLMQGKGSWLGMAAGGLTASPLAYAFSTVALFDDRFDDASHMVSSLTFSNSIARLMIRMGGYAMGDNPGDAAAVQKGWEFYFLRKGYEPPP